MGGCRAPRVVSDTSVQVKEIMVTERLYDFHIGEKTVVDASDLDLLNTGKILVKKDKKTGIKLAHQVKDNELITSVHVPDTTLYIPVTDTTTTITNNRTTVQEEQVGFFEKLGGHLNFLIWVIVIVLVVSLLLKIILPYGRR